MKQYLGDKKSSYQSTESTSSNEFWNSDAALDEMVSDIVQFGSFVEFFLTTCALEDCESWMVLVHVLIGWEGGKKIYIQEERSNVVNSRFKFIQDSFSSLKNLYLRNNDV